MSIQPDKTSPYAQLPQYGGGSNGAGDEEEPPQPAFSYLVGHTPDQLYANTASTNNYQSTTLPTGGSPKVPPSEGPIEDWLPPLQSDGYVKRGLPRHTFSDVGQSNPGYNTNEYSASGNNHHSSTGNLARHPGSQNSGNPYAMAAGGQPRNSNYPSDFTGQNPADRQTGHYEGFTDRKPTHYEAFPDQRAEADIHMNDMSPGFSGRFDDTDSQKRRATRPTTKQAHLGKLSSVSEESPRSPARYGCLCISAIVIAVVVALAAGFAAGWFLNGMSSTGECRGRGRSIGIVVFP